MKHISHEPTVGTANRRLSQARRFRRMARGQRPGRDHFGGLASWRQMSKSSPRRFPVTITQLPLTRCQICHRTVAYRPGNLSQALTEHYRQTHPETLGLPAR